MSFFNYVITGIMKNVNIICSVIRGISNDIIKCLPLMFKLLLMPIFLMSLGLIVYGSSKLMEYSLRKYPRRKVKHYYLLIGGTVGTILILFILAINGGMKLSPIFMLVIIIAFLIYFSFIVGTAIGLPNEE